MGSLNFSWMMYSAIRQCRFIQGGLLYYQHPLIQPFLYPGILPFISGICVLSWLVRIIYKKIYIIHHQNQSELVLIMLLLLCWQMAKRHTHKGWAFSSLWNVILLCIVKCMLGIDVWWWSNYSKHLRWDSNGRINSFLSALHFGPQFYTKMNCDCLNEF